MCVCVESVWKKERGREEERKKAGNQFREMKERRGQERVKRGSREGVRNPSRIIKEAMGKKETIFMD